MAKTKKSQSITDAIGLDQINELLANQRKLTWMNIKVGMLRGFGGVIGAALAILIIGFLVAELGGLPIIGEFLQKIGSAANVQ
jgi:hypothetical protein